MKRYTSINKTQTESGKRVVANAIYPEIPLSENDIYLIATAGDRYDILAQEFYNDSSLWWIIASSNNHQKASLVPTPGQQLRIPHDQELALELYEQVNKSR